MTSLRLSSSLRSAAILLVAIAASVLFFGVQTTGFLATENLTNIIEQTAVISIVAFGMTVVIINRGIDLSVGASLALAGVLGAKAMQASGGSALVAVAVVLGTALAVGALNGLLIAVLRVNAFMATLGTYALAGGAAISVSEGAATAVTDPALLWLGSASILGIPLPALVTVVLLVLFHLLMRRTLLGRWFYAQGGHRDTAVASGVPVRLVEFIAYVALGFAVGVGSLVTVGRVSSAQPLAGLGLEFSAITAAIIGGTSLRGGRGDVVNTFLGSVFVGTVSAGLSFLGVDQALIYVSTGVLIVAAVLVSQRDVLQALRDRTAQLAASVRGGRVQTVAADAPRGRDAVGTSDGVGGHPADHTLEVDAITKRFAGVPALREVSFTIESGEVVALMGENGAGKSTLVKVLAGNHQPTSGTIRIDSAALQFATPDASQRSGIAVIHQHFTLVPDLTVAENLFLGDEPRWGRIGPIRRRVMRARSAELLDDLEIPCRPETLVSSLSVGHRQMIEIAKAVHARAWLVIMDEPSSALSSRERDRLYAFIERLRRRNTAILYISHKMEEVFHVADRAVVLRDGQVVGAPQLAEVAASQLVSMMVGRDIDNVFPYVPAEAGDPCLLVRNACDGGALRDATLQVRAGEVVGLVGLMGSGRSELMRTVMGLSPLTSGSVEALGRDVRGSTASQNARLGVAFVPEDRHAEGILPDLSVAENLSLLWIRSRSRMGWLPRSDERRLVDSMVQSMGVRPPDPWREIRFLSGGNQQKVVLGRWLALSPRLVLLDDPTRGVDVGAKAEIHSLVVELKRQGVGVLMTSSEMPEVLGVADRVVVMRHGRTVATYDRGVSEEQVMQDAFGDQVAGPETASVSGRSEQDRESATGGPR